MVKKKEIRYEKVVEYDEETELSSVSTNLLLLVCGVFMGSILHLIDPKYSWYIIVISFVVIFIYAWIHDCRKVYWRQMKW